MLYIKKIRNACGALFGASSARANKVRSRPTKCGGKFSLFAFCLSFRKNKCAKLVLAETGLSNPRSAVGRKELKTVSVSVEVLKCRSLKEENFVLVLPSFLCPSTGRITYNVWQAGVSFLLSKVIHLCGNTQKITLACCYVQVFMSAEYNKKVEQFCPTEL